MSKSLIIVESPAKVKTLKKFVGKEYDILASVGHIKDLPKKSLGVDIENNFAPQYEVLASKKKVIGDIKKAAVGVDNVYLASDPDREGEAIAWHIAEEISKKKVNIRRVLFTEITKNAVLSAIKNPQSLNENLYHSQIARRVLDRLVGYKISPILWKKVRMGLSAGRVQSVALRIIVEREKEIEKFVVEEFWKIHVTLLGNNPPAFSAKLIKRNDENIKIGKKEEAEELQKLISGSQFNVLSVVKKEKRRSAPPPFITSSMQQEAFRRYRFAAKKTMMIAQRLYEGVEIGSEGSVGLISYMRTDSTRISDEALTWVREHIGNNYGKEYLPSSPLIYKAKKHQQDAHEAIRPTSPDFSPDKIKDSLSKEDFLLYSLIWNRFVASQMVSAIYDKTDVDIKTDTALLFKAQGSILKFDGFLKVYQDVNEEVNGDKDKDEGDGLIPDLKENEKLNLVDVLPTQHFTQPPPRFNDSSLIREMEENGIGRPSTYAAILDNIQSKGYVIKDKAKFAPTELGVLVSDLLVQSFPNILDIEFTANMEEKLDQVAEGKDEWVKIIRAFYETFKEKLSLAEKDMRDVKREEVATEYKCEKCESPMVVKWGKNGRFLACTAYPNCKNTKEIILSSEGGVKSIVEPKQTDEICVLCGAKYIIKEGRFGKFLACINYPNCKSTKPFKIGITCPIKDCNGDVVERRSKKGKIFFGCSNYPKCTFASWYKPVLKSCPNCGNTFLVEKYTKTREIKFACPEKGCNYSEDGPN